MKKMQMSILILLVVFISGCTANKELTTAQINKIKTISVHKPKLVENIEFEVLGSARDSKVQDTVGMAGGGFIPSLIGALIDSGIDSYNQGEFEDKHAGSVDKIKGYQIKNIDEEIESRILSVIKKDSFLNVKIVDKSPAFFDARIYSMGLQKRYKDQNNKDYLAAKITLVVSLKEEEDENLLYSKYLTVYSEGAFSVTELSNDNSLVDELFTQAYDSFEDQFAVFVNEAFKNKQL